MSSKNIKNLFEQMNPKKVVNTKDILSELPSVTNNKSNNKSDEKLSDDETPKTSKKMENFNYYAILGIKSSASSLEIKRAYQQKLKLYHPDKVEQTKENKDIYKLIREAGELLKNEGKRKAYDMERKMEKTNKDFLGQKNDFEQFLKLQEANNTEENKKLAQLQFEKDKKELNKKHGYNEDEAAIKLSKEESKRRFEDLILQREQEELEINHKNMFEGQAFNPDAFNKMFEKRKKQAGVHQGKNSMVKYDELSAFNDGLDFASSLNSNETYDDLYDSGQFNEYNANYTGVGNGLIGNLDDNNSDLSIGSSDIEDTYDTHNKNKGNVNDMMKKMMAERDSQDKAFENMTDVDYKSAIDDKFGVSNGLGFMVGDKLFGDQKSIKHKPADSTSRLKAYKALLENKK